MSELMVAAIRYAEQGWPVFPCEPQGKTPLTKHSFKDATTDQNTIRQWWQRWPDANISVPMGLATGLVAIDIDGQKGRDTLAALEAQHGRMPETLQNVTGRGRHYIFQCPNPPIRNTQGSTGMGIGDGIDTRGEGGYIMVSPSIHPSGAVYQWEGDHGATAELPDWLNPLKVHAARLEKRSHKAPNTPPWQRDRDDIMRRASLYLAQMPEAIQGNGGHSSLYAAATALVHGFEMSESQAFNLLASEYNPRCSPPWDLANPKEAKEFRRKISQAKTQPHDNPRG